jgi:Rieske Fe-S protein
MRDMTPEAARDFAARVVAEDRAPPERRPLFRPLPPAPAFPVQALGPLRDPVEAVRMRTQAPAAVCANSVLAGATLSVQAQRDVELPGAGRKPLTELFVSVAESGERKTGVDRVALAPVYRTEERWREEAEARCASHRNDLDAWKAAREQAKARHMCASISGARAAHCSSVRTRSSLPAISTMCCHYGCIEPWQGPPPSPS